MTAKCIVSGRYSNFEIKQISNIKYDSEDCRGNFPVITIAQSISKMDWM